MNKNIIKIITGVFIAITLTSCSQMDAYKFLIMGNKTGNWGNDAIDLFGRDEEDNDDWWDVDDEDDDDDDNRRNSSSSSNNNKNSSSSSNNSNNNSSSNNNNNDQNGYTGLNYLFDSASGGCGVYAPSGLADENVVVAPTAKDSNGTTYQVKYDCNNGFCALANLKTITFSDGFERLNVGFGSSINLIKVVLPSSFNRINARILVACSSFKTIEFKGTKSQWEAVDKIESWNYMAPEFTVKCSDGDIIVPVYVEED